MSLKVNVFSLKFKLEYGTAGSSGLDLRATEFGTLYLRERKVVSTGIYIEIPEGYEGQVRQRSGLYTHHGVTPVMGTIDSDYRGEIKVALVNLGQDAYTFYVGDKIAQLVICPVMRAELEHVPLLSDLSETERGSGGFGSTGR